MHFQSQRDAGNARSRVYCEPALRLLPATLQLFYNFITDKQTPDCPKALKAAYTMLSIIALL